MSEKPLILGVDYGTGKDFSIITKRDRLGNILFMGTPEEYLKWKEENENERK